MSSHFLLQGIFPTQGSNPGLLHWRQILYQMSHQRTPSNEYSVLISFRIDWFDPLTVQGILQARILEWVTFPSPGGLSNPRDRMQVSRIAGRFFYQLSHKGSPRILKWVAYPFSSRSSRPRNLTGVSCITGRFFTNLGFLVAQSVKNPPAVQETWV